ncbi:hypothetical protein [Bacillus thuringiensis]|uniref:hypothetical protein n=1 Tax=Bacillus thuringiensis TaxID=1428 RepID=UPI003CED2FFA
MKEKDLNISEVRGAKKNISDLQVYGDGDTFALLCKASSQEQGWMKSTKVCNVDGGCVMQVTTQHKNPDGSYAVAEALTYVPGVYIDKKSDPRRLVPIPTKKYEVNLLVEQGKQKYQSSWSEGAEEK